MVLWGRIQGRIWGGMFSKFVSMIVRSVLLELRLSGRDVRRAFSGAWDGHTQSLGKVLRARAQARTADFVESNMVGAVAFEDSLDVRKYAAQLAFSGLDWQLEAGSDLIRCLEFGVFKGESARLWASEVEVGGRVIGFDSFQGLSEDWIGTRLPKGQFDLGGEMPQVPDNVELVKGWVEETLPNWLRENSLEKVSLVHMDLDTYSPTFRVLSLLRDKLKPGTLILFDEYFGYPGWENHEHRALLESGIEFEYLAYSTNDIGLGSENVLVQTR